MSFCLEGLRLHDRVMDRSVNHENYYGNYLNVWTEDKVEV
jgi:hypothetical protein